MGAELDEATLRDLAPQVLAVLVRRAADFAAAEDAVQDRLLTALELWPTDPPRDPQAWLAATAWRKSLDAVRSESARRARELRVDAEPAPGDVFDHDDTLELYLRCAPPSLPPSSAVALTLRAVGGLTPRQRLRFVPGVPLWLRWTKLSLMSPVWPPASSTHGGLE